MLKKYILTAAISALLLAPVSAGATTAADPQPECTEVCCQGEQTDVTGDWVDSRETNTVQQSELTRKALQAEKARNAAENDEYGFAITIIAMVIVVAALAILSILFLIFGKISSSIMTKKKKAAHGVDDSTAEDHHEETDSGEVIAAIGMALAEHFGQGHDIQDTILTIRRMRKAYSPWNSKIYNLRSLPQHDGARRPLK